MAQEVIDTIHLSSAYLVEIHFDQKNKLLAKPKLEIRHAGAQKRHITPIGLIERILLQPLQIGCQPSEIIKAVAFKLELFKPGLSAEESCYIQNIFDYFKHKDKQSISGVITFIKIVMHFYHQNIYLTVDDSGVKIPYRTNDCYLVPTLEFGGDNRIHQAEGSFIHALLKILDGFEKLASKNHMLSKQQLCQLMYTIFAMFDFLPLPKHAPKKNPDAQQSFHKQRYVGEEVSRLYAVAARHLLFIFEAYPALAKTYKKDIISSFLSLLAEGISEEKLCKLFNVTSLADVTKKINKSKKEKFIVTSDYLKTYFTNAINSQGFAQQYQMSVTDFLRELNKNVQNLLTQRDEIYLTSLDQLEDKSEGEEAQLQGDLDSYIIEILFISYFYDKQMEQDFTKLSEYASELNINLQVFDKDFETIYYKLLSKEFKHYSQSLTIEEINNIINKIMTSGAKDAFTRILQITREAIKEAYEKNKVEFTNQLDIQHHFKKVHNIYKKINQLRGDINWSLESSDRDFTLLSQSFESGERAMHSLSKVFPPSPKIQRYSQKLLGSSSEEESSQERESLSPTDISGIGDFSFEPENKLKLSGSITPPSAPPSDLEEDDKNYSGEAESEDQHSLSSVKVSLK